MARVLYTAQATVTGGRVAGHGRTNDGALDVQLRSPKQMGGQGGGTNPEQLFAVGYAACFESALGVVGRRERAEVGDVSRQPGEPPTHPGARLPAGRRARRNPAAGSRSRAGQTDRCRRRSGMPILERHQRQHRPHADRQRPRRLNRSPTTHELPGAVKAFSGHLSPEFDTVTGDSAAGELAPPKLTWPEITARLMSPLAAAKCPITEVDPPAGANEGISKD